MIDNSSGPQKGHAAMAAQALTAVKGMNDILPPDSAQWEWLEAQVREVMATFDYRNIRTPIVEPTALFVRGLGELTDIVDKEMYSFEDKLNGDALTLRPENTAGVVRAVVQHNLLYEGGKRLYYMGPMFRHERPQRGRYRQFHQVGAEALGFGGPEVDAEIILLADAIWKKLGLSGIRLELNSLGQPDERRAHRDALVAYFQAHAEQLDADSLRRLELNPLRILDSKNPALQVLIEHAPRLIDYLGADSLQHFDTVQAILRANDVAFGINPRLVRGIDYYHRTVFEFITERLGAQGTICGGGRYDGLIAQIGGKPAPAIGWGFGMERVLELVREESLSPPVPVPDAYAIVLDSLWLPQAMRALQSLRSQGVRVAMHASGVAGAMASAKSQFKKADASGAPWALVLGPDEMAQQQASVKALRGQSPAGLTGLTQTDSHQTRYALADIPALAQALTGWRSTIQGCSA